MAGAAGFTVVVAAGFTVVVAAVSMEVALPTAGADFTAEEGEEDIGEAVPTAAREHLAEDLLAGEVTTEAALVVDQRRVTTGKAGDRTAGSVRRAEWPVEIAGLNPATISARWEIARRILVRRSVMDSGIRSATPVVPGIPAQDATQETSLAPAFPLTTREDPTGAGALLARQGALHR